MTEKDLPVHVVQVYIKHMPGAKIYSRCVNHRKQRSSMLTFLMALVTEGHITLQIKFVLFLLSVQCLCHLSIGPGLSLQKKLSSSLQGLLSHLKHAEAICSAQIDA